MRVADICEEIARKNGMNSDGIDLAWLCGLLHDIGRFEQLRIWKTFHDSESIDHAKLGVAILRGEELAGIKLCSGERILDRYLNDSELASIVETAVELHNVLHLPISLGNRARTFCEILRDADKIDIIHVFSQSSCESILGMTSNKLMNCSISDAAMIGFREQRCLGPEDRETPLDRLVGTICLSFEIVNKSGVELLYKYGYMDDLINHPFGLEMQLSQYDAQKKWNEICAWHQKIGKVHLDS